jgi:hypothetical protein
LAKIIISYRRSDSDVFAGRVRDRIAGRYGENSVFIDVDNIPFGKDFRVHIQEVMAEADAVLIIIGPKWLGAGKGGNSRIKDDADPVRIEVETALGNGTPTIPILVGKTNMPKPEQLPDSLRDFAFINAAPVDTGRDFHRDLNRVMATINGIVGLPLDTAERAAIVASSSSDSEPTVTLPKREVGGIEKESEKNGLVGHQAPSRDNFEAMVDTTAVADRTAADSSAGRRGASFWLALGAIATGCLLVVGVAAWIFMPQSKTLTTTSATPQLTAIQSTGGEMRNLAAPSTIAPVQPTPSVPAAQTKSAESATSDPGADVVRGFYAALGRGDGAAAAAFVIPERQKGGLGAQAMTDFFSSNFRPLQLIGVAPYGQNTYQATYIFQKTSKSVACANSVIVSVTQRNGQYLIQNIDARGGC